MAFDDNPYRIPAASTNADADQFQNRRRSNKILIVSLATGLLGICGIALSIVLMIRAFDQVALQSSPPIPNDLASNINRALYPMYLGLILMAIGILYMCTAKVRRRRDRTEHHEGRAES
ncbi:MAG: hypothetical protein KDB03_06010 [Planctomycetales bacterium]|nr:hypothetical protein [Planctomycetales bacterium]